MSDPQISRPNRSTRIINRGIDEAPITVTLLGPLKFRLTLSACWAAGRAIDLGSTAVKDSEWWVYSKRFGANGQLAPSPREAFLWLLPPREEGWCEHVLSAALELVCVYVEDCDHLDGVAY